MRKAYAYLPAVVLLAGCALMWKTRAQVAVPLAAPLTGVLSEYPGFSVRNQVVSEEERRIAGMTDYIAREYSRDSLVAFTTLVSYYDRQSQGKTIHSPRNCLPGAGWEILRAGNRVVTVDGKAHTVNHYILKNGAATAVAFYWYQGRGRVVANEYQVKWNLLRDAAIHGRTEEALVRVVVFPSHTPTVADSAALERAYAAADVVGDEVAKKLMREVTRVLPQNPASAPSS